MPDALSTDLDSPDAVPYFLWDEPLTIAALKHKLAFAANEERFRLLGKILREARDTDVWKFTTPGEVWQNWSHISKHLGRRRAFWLFLFEFWAQQELLDEKHAR